MDLISIAELRNRTYGSRLNQLQSDDDVASLAIGEASNRIERFVNRQLRPALHTMTFYPKMGTYDPMLELYVVALDDWPVHRVASIAKSSKNSRLVDDIEVEPYFRRSGDEYKRYVTVSYEQYYPITITFYAGYRLSDETDATVNASLGLTVENASITINWASVASGLFIEHVVAGTVGNGYTVTFEYDGSITNGEAVAEYGDDEITIKCRGVVTYGEAIDAINAARLDGEQIVEASISTTGSANRATSKTWTSADSAVTGMLSGGEGNVENGPITWPVMPEAISGAVTQLVVYEVSRMESGAIGRRQVSQIIQSQDVEANFQSEASFDRGIMRRLQPYRRMTSILDD